jgi:glycosyltransferase involved in cell wall biosynthesis
MRIAFVVNRDRFFLSHFVERALSARAAGHEVVVLAPDTGAGKAIEATGLRYVPMAMNRHGTSLWHLWAEVRTMRALYRQIGPDIVHHFGLRPIIVGTLAARFDGGPRIVNAPVGMGFAFASSSWKARLIRYPLLALLRVALNPHGSRVVFENVEDRDEMIRLGAVRAADAVVIRGAGVDVDRFAPTPAPQGRATVLFAARLIREKGVGVFVDAARLARAKGCDARFVIVGEVDRSSSTAVPESELRAWVDDGVVEWWGYRDDMPAVLAAASIFCLPTWYREGMPKVVLEAMACARAVVVTDTVGCREAVEHGISGLLVPPKDAVALANAIGSLLDDPLLRRRLADCGRRRAVAEFSSERVIRETLALYHGAERSR